MTRQHAQLSGWDLACLTVVTLPDEQRADCFPSGTNAQSTVDGGGHAALPRG